MSPYKKIGSKSRSPAGKYAYGYIKGSEKKTQNKDQSKRGLADFKYGNEDPSPEKTFLDKYNQAENDFNKVHDLKETLNKIHKKHFNSSVSDGDEEMPIKNNLPESIHSKGNGSSDIEFFKTPDQGDPCDFKKSGLKKVKPAVTEFNQMNVDAELNLQEILDQSIN